MKQLKKWKSKSNKKGFTLIEIIVVLVILAILAAATVPAMIGFVNDARGKAFVAEARVGVVAAQAVVTECLAAGGRLSTGTAGAIVYLGDTTATTVVSTNTFKNMVSDVTGYTSSYMPFSGIKIDAATSRVTDIVYQPNGTAAGTIKITISKGTTTVEKN